MGSFHFQSFIYILMASSLCLARLLRPLDGTLTIYARVHPEVFLRRLRQGYELGSTVSQ